MYNAIIIGSGPAGFECALEIAKLGGRAALIEKEALGGTCTNYGCIPTKALIASVKTLEEIKNAARKGIEVKDFSLNYPKIQDRKKRLVSTLQKGIELQLKNHNIELIKGTAEIISKDSVKIGDKTLKSQNIVLATGSEPIHIFQGQNILTSKELLDIDHIPEKLVIIGGGVIGVELGYIFKMLGSAVTIIEAQPQILPTFDPDLAAEASLGLKKLGINILTNSKANFENQILSVNNQAIAYDKILVSVGRKPVFPKNELEKIGVLFEKNKVIVNDQLQTNLKNFYAIGDVTNICQLAHVASYQALIAAKNIMGKTAKADYSAIPSCVYSEPQIAAVGLKESDCDPEKTIIKKASYSANGKARCQEKITGFLKIIADKNSQTILGVHIIGEEATNLISNATTLVKNKLKLSDITDTIHAHPTLGELFFEALKHYKI
jgi:dihydrolipoamide dehydrogenase